MMYTNYGFEYVKIVTLPLHSARLLWFQPLLSVGVDGPHCIYLLISLMFLNSLFLKFNSRPKSLYLCLNFCICICICGAGLLLRLSIYKSRHLLVCGVTNQLSILKKDFIVLKRFTNLFLKKDNSYLIN